MSAKTIDLRGEKQGQLLFSSLLIEVVHRLARLLDFISLSVSLHLIFVEPDLRTQSTIFGAVLSPLETSKLLRSPLSTHLLHPETYPNAIFQELVQPIV